MATTPHATVVLQRSSASPGGRFRLGALASLFCALALSACARVSDDGAREPSTGSAQPGAVAEPGGEEMSACGGDSPGTSREFGVRASRWNALVRGLPANAETAAAALEAFRDREGILLELNGVPNETVAAGLGGHVVDDEISEATFLFRGNLAPPAGPDMAPEFDAVYEATATSSVRPDRAWPVPSGAEPVAVSGSELFVQYVASTICAEHRTSSVPVWLAIRPDASFHVRAPQPVAAPADIRGPGTAMFGEAPAHGECSRLRPFARSAYAVCGWIPAIDVPGRRHLIFWQLQVT